MDLVILIIRLALAAIFFVAGFGKLSDLDAGRRSLTSFGVPPLIVPVMAYVLPIVEIAVAALLLWPGASWPGAVLASAMLVTFTAAMLYQLSRGNAPDCNCFGAVHSEPVSAAAIVRNLVFLAASAILVFRAQGGQGTELANLTRDDSTLIFAFAAAAIALLVLIGQRRITGEIAQMSKRLNLIELMAAEGGAVRRDEAGSPEDGLPIGAMFPPFELSSAAGGTVDLASILSDGKPFIAFFVSPTCTPCGALAPEIDRWAGELDGRVRILIVSSGDVEANIAKFNTVRDHLILIENDRELSDVVMAKWTPSAVFVGADGLVRSHVAVGDAAITSMAERIIAAGEDAPAAVFADDRERPTKFMYGQPVPQFSVNDVAGKVVDDGSLRGRRSLLVFWSSTCPHCAEMHDDLTDWLSAKPDGAPSVHIFTNSIDTLNGVADTATVIVDPEHETAGELGMYGTPSAVMIDENGVFVSETAVGAGNIWALLGRFDINR